jgi:hypothetical protein
MAYPSVASASGTEIYVSTVAPATHDEAGFEAIAGGSWNKVGYLTSGSLPKPVRNYNEVKTLDGNVFVVTGTESMADIEFGCVYQPGDAGQDVLEANSDGVTLLYWKAVLPGATAKTVFWAGYSTGYSPAFTDVEGHVSADVTCKPVFDDQGVGPVLATN